MNLIKCCVLVLLGLCCLHAPAAPADPEEATPPSPPPGEEYQINEYEQGSTIIQEYRIRGFLHGIRVIPKRGKPYFLVNSDGDNSFTRPENSGHMLVPQWKIMSW